MYNVHSPKEGCWVFDVINQVFLFHIEMPIYLALVYLVTALVPSETACLANSPGNKSRTAV